MFPRIITPNVPQNSDQISALVEPREGESVDDIMTTLQRAGAVVRRLAAGVLSVRASRSSLEKVSGVARVSIRHESALR